MGSNKFLVSLVVVSILLLHLTTAEGSLFDYLKDKACKMAVDCGKGKCVVRSNHKHPFKFVCKCEPGWKQIKAGPKHMFLPKSCVIPESECSFYTELNPGQEACI